MTNHSAKTCITGMVTNPIRCHQYASGTVANFVVAVTIGSHTESYKCVAFKELGATIERSIQQGQIVSVVGLMKTTPWTDGSGKENHQLITNEFKIQSVNRQPVRAKPTTRKPDKVLRNVKVSGKSGSKDIARSDRKSTRKKKHIDDFRAVLDEPPPFNDPLPF